MSKAEESKERREMLTWAFEFQMILHELDQEYQSCEGNSSEVLKELEREWGQISHFQNWCVQQLETDDGAAIMCSKLAGVGGNLLNQFQSLSQLDLIRWREAGLAGARKMKLIEDQIGHLTYLSYAHFTNNNVTKALELIEEAIVIGQQQKDSIGYATALQHRGMFFTQMERETEALELLNESLSIFEKLGEDNARAKCFSALATCYSRLKEHQKAIDLNNKAIEIEDTQSAVGTYLCNMSGDLMKLHQFPEAMNCLLKAEQIAYKLSDLTLKGLVFAHFGQWYSAQKDAELRSKTWNYYEDALTIFRKKGERYHELQIIKILESLYSQVLNSQQGQLSYDQQSAALRKLIQLSYAQSNFTNNHIHCNRLLDLAEAQKNLPDQLEALISIGQTATQLKKYDQAILSHTKAIKVLQKIREHDGQDVNLKAEGELYISLGQAYRHSDQPDKAIQCYEKAEKIAEILHKPGMKYRAKGNLGLIYADTGNYSDAVALLNRTIEYYDREKDYRLLGHAQFNLAYTFYRKGDALEAQAQGADALRFLLMINDSHVEEVKRQIESWK